MKRKRLTTISDEGNASKRQLRSGLTIQISTSKTNRVVTSSDSTLPSRPARLSPKKRQPPAQDIILDFAPQDCSVDDSDDEFALASRHKPGTTSISSKVVQTSSGRDNLVRENQAFTDETNSARTAADESPDSDDFSKEKAPAQRGSPRPIKQISTDPSAHVASVGRVSDIFANTTPYNSATPKTNPRLRQQPKRGSLVVETTINATSKRTRRLLSASRRTCSPTINASPNCVSIVDDLQLPSINTSYPTESPPADNAGILPVHLHPYLNAQKSDSLKALQCPPCTLIDNEELQSSVNDVAATQLNELINGTVMRAEGNSCLLLGPRGTGKSRMLESCICNLSVKPIILRLCGWLQSTDRHALREIAFQLLQQTGSSILPESESAPTQSNHEINGEEENPFLDSIDDLNDTSGDHTLRFPPSSHLHALIPVLLTLSRPVIVVLDAFDLFALHPRQSLLYCLLDTVQNCRASSESRGIAVIGLTSRVDTVQLLEKRVKSRFSGRTIHTAPPGKLQHWLGLIRSVLQPLSFGDHKDRDEEWRRWWTSNVDKFLADQDVLNVFNETFSITRDVKTMERLLMTPILRLSPNEPYLAFKSLSASIEAQRSRPRNYHLTNLSYPTMCLLIASIHADTAGHSAFTFEMLFDNFRDQVRASTSAPVQVNGGNIGMVRCTRDVLISAFDGLITANIFVCVVGPSFSTAKEFVKHRSVLDRNIVKGIIEKSGQIHLKKWLNKGP